MTRDTEDAGGRPWFDPTIGQSSVLLAAVLIACLAAMAVASVRLTIGMDAVSDGWRRYDLEAATKSDALSDLRGHLGLGGVIDRFHESVSARDPGAAQALGRSLALARANLDVYRNIVAPTSEEQAAIAAVADLLTCIETSTGATLPPEFEESRRNAVSGLRILNSHLTLERARLNATTQSGIDELQRMMAVFGGIVGALVLGLAGAAVWFTRARILEPLRRLVADAGRLARRELDTPFHWRGRNELSVLGRTLEDSRGALAALFAAIEENSRRLQISERRYALAAAAANDGLWDWNRTTDETYRSERMRQMLGLADADERTVGLGWLLDRADPDDRPVVERTLRAFGSARSDGFEIEFRTRPGSGAVPWVLLRGVSDRDPDGRVQRLVGSASDISERKSYEGRLVHQATHDTLTGLPNRALLLDWLGQRLRRARAAPLALLFLDLDGFKMVNDSLGHGVGDTLLRDIGRRLSEGLRPNELVARLGGDEFVLAIDGAGPDEAMRRAAGVARRFRQPFAVEGMELSIAASIGIAVEDDHTGEPEDLLRDADIALYRAKENGRGRAEVFDVALREAVQIRHRLQRDLDRALSDGEIFTVYQPIQALASGRVTGFEALVRWRHPELGLISPAQFVPIAEETGAILPLGRTVLDQAIESLARFRRLGAGGDGLTINVNFSPRQMWDDGHVDEILSRLAASPGIKIEVTESLAMANPDAARAVLERFRRCKVELCIDDFGTGYSSLSYLGDFPFDILKLDKSFLAGMGVEGGGRGVLVRGVVNLAHDLGLKVVAEGIETPEELAQLRGLGCDMGQGYHIARPMPADDACAFLARGPG